MYKPWLLLARITKKCNANCRYCIREYVKDITPDMDINLYKKLVDDTEDYIKEVQPIGFGEPLLYPHIVEAVRYASSKGKRVVTYSNASLLTPKMSWDLLNAGLTEIRFSLEAKDKDTFEILRRPLKWDTVYNNIIEFQRIKNEQGFKCQTTVAGCISPENKDSIDEIVDFWKERVDYVFTRPEQIFSVPSMHRPLWVKGKHPCKHTKEYLSVDWNGDVVLCCRDIFSEYKFGNVHYVDPLDIFNNKDFNDMREGMYITGNKKPIICNYCRIPSKRVCGGKQLEWLTL